MNLRYLLKSLYKDMLVSATQIKMRITKFWITLSLIALCPLVMAKAEGGGGSEESAGSEGPPVGPPVGPPRGPSVKGASGKPGGSSGKPGGSSGKPGGSTCNDALTTNSNGPVIVASVGALLFG